MEYKKPSRTLILSYIFQIDDFFTIRDLEKKLFDNGFKINYTTLYAYISDLVFYNILEQEKRGKFYYYKLKK